MNKVGRGFTIVEILIVVVIIAILTTITIVAYRGVTEGAKKSAALAELKDYTGKVKLAGLKGGLPASLEAASIPTSTSNATFSYTRYSASSFCLTAVYKNELSFHQKDEEAPEEGPCDGHSGGPKYCPTNTHVPINGFYCDGTIGAIATLNSSAVKLLASTSPVPPGAPGAYVGRQTTRDNLTGSSFSVTPGDTYCIEGWVSTVDSTVSHAIGLQYTNSSSSNSWVSFGSTTPAAAMNQWVKVGSCRAIPANVVTARFWTQNNGTTGTTAAPAWYQTSLRFWKQS